MSSELTSSVQIDWEGRRIAAAERLSSLKRARGIALLEGKNLNHREVLDAEAEVDAINAAIIEAERRRRSEQDAAHKRYLADVRKNLQEELSARSQAISEAEAAAYKLAAALTSMFASTKKASTMMQQLGVNAASVTDAQVRLCAGIRLSHILYPATGRYLGPLNMPESVASNGRLRDGSLASESWHDVDAKRIAIDAELALKPQEERT